MNTTNVPKRRETRSMMIGSVGLGSDYPIRVQSMTNTDTHDVQKTLAQISDAVKYGAELMRVSIPDENSLGAFKELVRLSPVPLIADIHFDYRLAIGAIRAGAHKIRINPGNIGSNAKLREIADAAMDHGIPIRVGVNSGSIHKKLLRKYGHPSPEALVESALIAINLLEQYRFHSIILSLKGSDVLDTVDAYRMITDRCDYPLHIGITESGTLLTGTVRSSVGVGILLNQGIGDTIRISLAAMPAEEVKIAYRILEALKIRFRYPLVIACPTCGRTQIDVIKIASECEKILGHRSKPLVLAIMGCAVNGPGEAREADIGIAGGKGEALVFSKGNPLKKIKESEIMDTLMELYEMYPDI
ncbi:flavodoxin-dependent (E)-4-hydroxy-3-methylbut-2-enyl-diphosphate synthase [bacterium]|nr:flavodoxin-dependent (E)-4-hydroxy-3-methylbut-2-enyl-diphosphate synthase [candidate division CSSED10-310 bacterium]